MPNTKEKVEFENKRVKVTRVNLGANEKHPRRRNDRVLIWLTDAHHSRLQAGGKKEEVRRHAGEVAWRDASQHEVENMAGKEHELIIVELKD